MILLSTSALACRPRRIISLVPSQTELLAYLRLEEETVGITKFCVHPAEWMQTKTIVGGTKNLHIETIRKLQPDLIIANKEENVQDQVELLAASFNLWVTDVNDLNSSLTMIRDIGELTQTSERATELVYLIEQSFKQIEIVPPALKTCYLIWRNPYMAAGGGTFINDMLAKCGFLNINATKARYPEIELKQLLIAGCELIMLSSEPYPFKQKHVHEIQLQLPGIKIVMADGEMFSWYGSRLLEAPAYFQKLIREVSRK